MQHVDTIASLRALRASWRKQGKTVGFVPTMGNLHAGHLQLVRAAKAACDVVVVSIFVNPMQFGANEDLSTYPRTVAEDKAKLSGLGVDVVFLPSAEEMYPRGLEQQTFVEVPSLSQVVCGASRPGHFRGVATIVCKLFNMVQPDQAFFGEKDYQQLQIIKTMVADLSLDVKVHGIPTEREADGLAMSSRNGYLTPEQRKIAPKLFTELSYLKNCLKAGESNFEALKQSCAQKLDQAGFKTDYVEIRDAETLQEPTAHQTSLVILAAAFLGNTRLIDNLQVKR